MQLRVCLVIALLGLLAVHSLDFRHEQEHDKKRISKIFKSKSKSKDTESPKPQPQADGQDVDAFRGQFLAAAQEAFKLVANLPAEELKTVGICRLSGSASKEKQVMEEIKELASPAAIKTKIQHEFQTAAQLCAFGKSCVRAQPFQIATPTGGDDLKNKCEGDCAPVLEAAIKMAEAIMKHKKDNKMGATNLATVTAPSIFHVQGGDLLASLNQLNSALEQIYAQADGDDSAQLF